MTIETTRRLPPVRHELPLVPWKEYLRWARTSEFPSEWVDGNIVEVGTQNLRSHFILDYLRDRISPLTEHGRKGLLMFGFLMRLPQVPSARQPDLMYVAEQRRLRAADTYLDGPADLVVEVVSADSIVRDRRDKLLEYEAGGVTEYWLIDERREEACFYVLGPNGRYREAVISPDGTYASTVLPELHVRVEALWHDPFETFRRRLKDPSRDPSVRRDPALGDHVSSGLPAPGMAQGRPAMRHYDPPLVSWEDFLAWALASERRAEWVDGEIVELMGDSVRHLLLIDFLNDILKMHVRRNRLGIVVLAGLLMKLSSHPSGRSADVTYIATEHLSRLHGTFLDGPADLVVEVVSPDSEFRDRSSKFGEYAEAGIPEYWLIDEPRHEARFYVLGADGNYQDSPLGEDGVYTSTVLPGLRLRVDWLWRDPLPTFDEALADLPA